MSGFRTGGILGVEAGDAAHHPTLHRTGPQQRMAWPQMPLVPRMRDPVPGAELGEFPQGPPVVRELVHGGGTEQTLLPGLIPSSDQLCAEAPTRGLSGEGMREAPPTAILVTPVRTTGYSPSGVQPGGSFAPVTVFLSSRFTYRLIISPSWKQMKDQAPRAAPDGEPACSGLASWQLNDCPMEGGGPRRVGWWQS